MDNWKNEVETHYNGIIEPFPLLVFGNKIDDDAGDKVITAKKAQEWINKRSSGENALFYEVSCKMDGYTTIIDNAFKELVQIVIKNNVKKLQTANEQEEEPLYDDDGKQRYDRTGARIDGRRNNRTCGGVNTNCLNPASSPSTDTFCYIL